MHVSEWIKLHRLIFVIYDTYCNYENWEDNIKAEMNFWYGVYFKVTKNGIYYKVYILLTKMATQSKRNWKTF